MIDLDALIHALAEARKEHGNLKCQVWISDSEGRAMTSEGGPSFDLIQSLPGGSELPSLAIDFLGRISEA